MDHGAHEGHPDPVAASLYDLTDTSEDVAGPDGRALTQADLDQIRRLLRALAHLRATERALLAASETYMRLSAQDMRAIHYLMTAARIGRIATPGQLAEHLGISRASTTKLLNRLEQDGHVVRRMHPEDRRAVAVEVTASTQEAARRTVGSKHARRLHAAARLTPAERESVIGFLQDMAAELSLDDSEWARAHR